MICQFSAASECPLANTEPPPDQGAQHLKQQPAFTQLGGGRILDCRDQWINRKKPRGGCELGFVGR